MPKLHPIPERILTADGKANYNPATNSRSEDITPKARKTRVCKPKVKEPWKPRMRAPGEATAPGTTWNRSIYRTGDGETLIPARIGADDHKQWRSLGNLT